MHGALQDPRDWHAVFARALGASIVAHAIVLGTMPGPRGPASLLPEALRLDARLVLMPREEALPEPLPDPPATPKRQTAPPAPPPPAPRIERATTPVETRVERPAAPPAKRAPPPVGQTTERRVAGADPPPREVIARAEEESRPPQSPVVPALTAPARQRSAAQTPPSIAAMSTDAPSAPAMPAATPPSGALVERYGQDVSGILATRQRYPRLAQIRGWQGTTELEIEFLAGGRTGEITVARSSGHTVLDDQALEMVRGAELPRRPDGLRNQTFALRVPIEFRLRN